MTFMGFFMRFFMGFFSRDFFKEFFQYLLYRDFSVFWNARLLDCELRWAARKPADAAVQAFVMTVDYDLLTKDYFGHPPINHRFLCWLWELFWGSEFLRFCTQFKSALVSFPWDFPRDNFAQIGGKGKLMSLLIATCKRLR